MFAELFELLFVLLLLLELPVVSAVVPAPTTCCCAGWAFVVVVRLVVVVVRAWRTGLRRTAELGEQGDRMFRGLPHDGTGDRF